MSDFEMNHLATQTACICCARFRETISFLPGGNQRRERTQKPPEVVPLIAASEPKSLKGSLVDKVSGQRLAKVFMFLGCRESVGRHPSSGQALRVPHGVPVPAPQNGRMGL